MNIDEMIEVLQAAKEGKQIQYRCCAMKSWKDTTYPSWDFSLYRYRVKPEPREFWLSNDGKYAHTKAEAEEYFGEGNVILVREVIK